jgi:hypothetical protein
MTYAQRFHPAQAKEVRTSLGGLSFVTVATACGGTRASCLHQVADHRVHILAEDTVGLHNLDVAEAHCQEQLHASCQHGVWEYKAVLARFICCCCRSR